MENMLPEEILLKEFTKKENQSNIYSYKIDGILIYPLIRRQLRDTYMRNKGYDQMDIKLGVHFSKAFFTLFVSLFQLLKLFFIGKKIKNIIHAFPRVEKVEDYFVDKFTDPVIKLTKLKDNALIFVKSFGGKRNNPRVFPNQIIYIDFIIFYARVTSKIRLKFLKKRDKDIILKFKEELQLLAGDDIDVNFFVKELMYYLYLTKIMSNVYRFLSVKKVFLLPRIPSYIYAAHLSGAEVYEFQHGVTYGESNLYSGRCLQEYTPDYFLAFGDVEPRDVYGISEDKIIIIGWAFEEYIKAVKPMIEITEKDVLVVCDPEITDILLDIVSKLAKHRPDIHFHFRAHPNQKITQQQLERINSLTNLYLQDNKINSNVVLNCFSNIIGENSTVLYEAVSVNKKVGKLFYKGLNSTYLKDSDRNNFFEIRNNEDFDTFIKAQPKQENNLSIYKPWNKNYSYIFE